MADNTIDILIKFGLDRTQAKEAAAQIKEIQNASTEAGKADVRAQADSTEATKKIFASKKDLKDMVKQLGHEIPLLGTIGRLALNPIAAVTAAITSAFLIWNRRVNELTISLGGIEMPDISEKDVDRINRIAAAYGKWAESVVKLSDQSPRLKAAAEAALKLAQFEDAINRALGGPGTDVKAAESRIKTGLAGQLEAEGRRLIAAGGTPGSVDSEKAVGEKYAAAAAKASADKQQTEARIAEILSFRSGEMNMLQEAKFLGSYHLRYGNMNWADALALERGNLSSQQGIIDRSSDFQRGVAERAARRGGITAGQTLLDQAAGLRGEAQSAASGSVTERVADASKNLNQVAENLSAALALGNFGKLAVVTQEFLRTQVELARVMQDVRLMRDRLNTQSQRPQ